MDAKELLEKKLGEYEAAFASKLIARHNDLAALNKNGQPVHDFPSIVQALDTAVLKHEFDSGLREIADDFVRTFNSILDMVVEKNPWAGEIVSRYRMRSTHQVALENQLRQAMPPLYSALNDLGAARAAYTNFQSSAGARSMGQGATGGTIGAAIGTMVAPGIGTAIGALIGGALASSSVDAQGQNLVQDFVQRYDAMVAAVTSAWTLGARMLEEQFQQYFGLALQHLGQEVESAKRQQQRLPASKQHPLDAPADPTQAEWPFATVAKRRSAWPVVAGLLVVLLGGAGFFMYRQSHARAKVVLVPSTAVFRQGPASGFDRVDIAAGSYAEVIDETVPGWVKVRASSGQEGWMSLEPER